MRTVVVEESSWWVAACAGDSAAFSQLFLLHRDEVFRYARRLVDSAADADDVAAAAFLELWRRRDAVRLVGGSVKPWLLVTAGNVARNMRRGTRRWRSVLEQLPRDTIRADPADVVSARVDGRRGTSGLSVVLRGLRPVDLGLLTLTVFEGYSVIEAAAVLGISDGTARSRLSRARARLRIQLGDDPTYARTVMEES